MKNLKDKQGFKTEKDEITSMSNEDIEKEMELLKTQMDASDKEIDDNRKKLHDQVASFKVHAAEIRDKYVKGL